jgi:hypothetical protein
VKESPLDPPRGKLEESSIYTFSFFKEKFKMFNVFKRLGISSIHQHFCFIKKLCAFEPRVSTSFGEAGFHLVPQKPRFVPHQKIPCHKNTFIRHEQ